jgi:uncharacterized protein
VGCCCCLTIGHNDDDAVIQSKENTVSSHDSFIPSRLIARELDINHIQFIPVRNKKLHIEEMLPLLKDKKYLIVDDIYDTGDTFTKVFDVIKRFDCDFAFLMTRYKDSNGNN